MILSGDTVNFALLLSLCVSLAVGMAVNSDSATVVSSTGGDCVLECTARYKPGVQYRSVKWYKVGEAPAPRLSGLLTKDLPNGTVQLYRGVERQVELLGESHDLHLPNVTCGDSGAYICHLAAPIGEQNREGRVLLTLTDCADTPTEEPVTVLTDTYMVIFASVLLILALVIFLISYFSLRNIIKDKTRTPKNETLLNAALKPLDKKDLQSIYRLGPKASPTMKHVYI